VVKARKDAGLPLTMGRKKGGTNRPKVVIEEERRAREAARALRRIEHQARTDKRARARGEAFRASVLRGSEPGRCLRSRVRR
jgi:hypothetical protein